jgi:hypothetical protein
MESVDRQFLARTDRLTARLDTSCSVLYSNHLLEANELYLEPIRTQFRADKASGVLETNITLECSRHVCLNITPQLSPLVQFLFRFARTIQHTLWSRPLSTWTEVLLGFGTSDSDDEDSEGASGETSSQVEIWVCNLIGEPVRVIVDAVDENQYNEHDGSDDEADGTVEGRGARLGFNTHSHVPRAHTRDRFFLTEHSAVCVNAQLLAQHLPGTDSQLHIEMSASLPALKNLQCVKGASIRLPSLQFFPLDLTDLTELYARKGYDDDESDGLYFESDTENGPNEAFPLRDYHPGLAELLENTQRSKAGTRGSGLEAPSPGPIAIVVEVKQLQLHQLGDDHPIVQQFMAATMSTRDHRRSLSRSISASCMNDREPSRMISGSASALSLVHQNPSLSIDYPLVIHLRRTFAHGALTLTCTIQEPASLDRFPAITPGRRNNRSSWRFKSIICVELRSNVRVQNETTLPVVLFRNPSPSPSLSFTSDSSRSLSHRVIAPGNTEAIPLADLLRRR